MTFYSLREIAARDAKAAGIAGQGTVLSGNAGGHPARVRQVLVPKSDVKR